MGYHNALPMHASTMPDWAASTFPPRVQRILLRRKQHNPIRFCVNLLGDGGASGAEAMEDAVDVLKVLPDELADARVFRDGVVASVVRLVA